MKEEFEDIWEIHPLHMYLKERRIQWLHKHMWAREIHGCERAAHSLISLRLPVVAGATLVPSAVVWLAPSMLPCSMTVLQAASTTLGQKVGRAE